ncbi:MAG: sigma factor-like helix-turn-helix DNA-binding protein [bacterium]|nr:sigma factor-like helix-turn-helix DNA-binding protein [bacterium]
MEKLEFNGDLRAVSENVLGVLNHKRMQEVLRKRFGLKGRQYTLEAIGQEYGVTRERVRQIEEHALKNLAQSRIADFVNPVAEAVYNHLSAQGDIAEEKKFFSSVADEKLHPHLRFLLTLSKRLRKRSENDLYHDRWFTKEEAADAAEEIVEGVVKELEGSGKSIKAEELFRIFSGSAERVLGASFKGKKAVDSYMSISKSIGQNPYGEYGLVSWPSINPKGVRDKAYVVLAKMEKPLHFSEVAHAINKVGWSKKKAHPQTVHNELIKDNRFVLVGRGLYGLSEWGYEPGTVKDVIRAVLAGANSPLSKDKVIERVLEKRFVKANTIFLNLQDKKHFKRVDEGYTLV